MKAVRLLQASTGVYKQVSGGESGMKDNRTRNEAERSRNAQGWKAHACLRFAATDASLRCSSMSKEMRYINIG